MSCERVVIIGAGEAGCRAAISLREKGFSGKITLVNAEAHMPYERPPLSKGLCGHAPILAAAQFETNSIDHLASAMATEIDRGRKTVILQDGQALVYDRLLLATGASARLLPALALGPRVRTLRTLDDAEAFHRMIQPGVRVAMIGAGFIGLELAAVARQKGAEVTVIEAQPRILMRGVPEQIAGVLSDRHRAEGVRIMTGAKLRDVRSEKEVVCITFADEPTINVDLAVVGIGASPNTGLAEACGLACGNGIVVDGSLRTSDPDIFAAGDCCEFPAAVYGGQRIRVESWRNAREQGEHAAGAMIGAVEPFVNVPWFWSDQYDLGLQVVGVAGGAARLVSRQLPDGGLMVFSLAGDGAILSAAGIGRGNATAKDIKIAELMIKSRSIPDPAHLADANLKLKSLLSKEAA